MFIFRLSSSLYGNAPNGWAELVFNPDMNVTLCKSDFFVRLLAAKWDGVMHPQTNNPNKWRVSFAIQLLVKTQPMIVMAHHRTDITID